MIATFVNVSDVRRADIVVGIASLNEADTIGFVVKQVGTGLRRHFPRLQSVIINCDNNSPDNTRQAFLAAPSAVPKLYVSTPPGVVGKGNNLLNLYALASRLRARVVVIVDADVTSISPDWIKHFAGPVLDGYDFVAPLYARHKYDGTITKTICYPLMYGLLGTDIRQPIGGDFAFSARLCQYWRHQPVTDAVRTYGIDIFMSSHAVVGGFKVCQAGVGAKVHKPSAPKLGQMFIQVVRSMFDIIIRNRSFLSRVHHARTVPVFGLPSLGRSQRLTVDQARIRRQALDGYRPALPAWRRFLSPAVYREVVPLYRHSTLSIGPELWVYIVYDLLVAYSRANVRDREIIVESLRPLYFGRVAAFMHHTHGWPTARVEAYVTVQARLFFKMRNYLIEKMRRGL